MLSFAMPTFAAAQDKYVETEQLIPAMELWNQGKKEEAIQAMGRLAVEKKNQKAAWTLVSIYRSEENKDMEKALEWLIYLSSLEVADARELIADLYYFGREVPADYEVAFVWYNHYILIERDPDILNRLATLHASGAGTVKNRVKAYPLFKEACEKEYIQACLSGRMLVKDMTVVERFVVKEFLK